MNDMHAGALPISVLETIQRRQSVRAYTQERLPRETLDTLLAAAVRAPTAMHEEQWTFVVVQGRTMLRHLSQRIRCHIGAGSAEHIAARPPGSLPSTHEDFNLFYDADTLILICAVPMGPFVAADCWLAAENLMLAACAMGLGSCVIGSAIAGLNTPERKHELGIPEEISVVAPIVLGWPASETHTTQRSEPVILSWIADEAAS